MRADRDLPENKITSIAIWKVVEAFFSPNGIRRDGYRSWWREKWSFRGRSCRFEPASSRSSHPRLRICAPLSTSGCTCTFVETNKSVWRLWHLVFHSRQKIGASASSSGKNGRVYQPGCGGIDDAVVQQPVEFISSIVYGDWPGSVRCTVHRSDIGRG